MVVPVLRPSMGGVTFFPSPSWHPHFALPGLSPDKHWVGVSAPHRSGLVMPAQRSAGLRVKNIPVG